MTARLLFDCTAEQYHRDPCDRPSLSASIATTLVTKSPLHAYTEHPRLGGYRSSPSPSMDLGTLVHAIVLGKGDHIAVVEGFDDWRTKAAQAARDQARAEGKTPVLERHVKGAKKVADVIAAQIAARGIDLTAPGSASEAVIEWEEESKHGPVLCRGMLDHLNLPLGRIIDLKCTSDASPEGFARSTVNYGIDIQSAAYTSAVEKLDPELAGRVEVLLVIAEVEPPYAVRVGRPGGSMRELGERRWNRAVATWAECLHTNHWPAYGDGIAELDVPLWAVTQEEAIYG